MRINQKFYRLFTPLRNFQFILVGFLLFTLASCHSSLHLSRAEFSELAKASHRLGMKIDYKDQHKLFIEASRWVGVRYRYGGKSRAGVDCSGLTSCIYRNVYGIQLRPNALQQYKMNVRERIRKSRLQQGDLVFFAPSGSARRINHVGIYLKNGKFIHASSSQGVCVDWLNDSYWRKRWVSGGRIVK